MGDPAHAARNSEHDSEHRFRDAQGLINYARVEVHVRVQIPFNEKLILEGNLFQTSRQLEYGRIFTPGPLKYAMVHLADDHRPRVVTLVDAVTKPHQSKRIVSILCFVYVLLETVGRTNFFQHVDNCLVGSAVRWSPQCGYTRSDRGIGICA